MNREELWDALVAAEVVRFQNQHIVLSSGEHTQQYANFVSTNVPRELRRELIANLAQEAGALAQSVSSVSEITILGIGCGYWYASMVAELYGGIPAAQATKSVRNVYQLVREQVRVITGRHVIIIDDVRNSGASEGGLIRLVRENRGKLLGAVYILDRAMRPAHSILFGEHEVPVKSLFTHNMTSWPSRFACPLCKKHVPFSTEHGQGPDEMFIHGQP